MGRPRLRTQRHLATRGRRVRAASACGERGRRFGHGRGHRANALGLFVRGGARGGGGGGAH
eukprot:2877169-Prymnesium_polylepis.1